MDVNKIREDFPILSRKMNDKPLVYLDNGATTLKPQCVIDAVCNYYTYLGANAHRGDYQMSAQVVKDIKDLYVPLKKTNLFFLQNRLRQGFLQLSDALPYHVQDFETVAQCF